MKTKERLEFERMEKLKQPIKSNVSNEDILFAHMVLKSSGATQEYKDRANSIYKQLFNEDVVYSCCKNKAYIKLDYYVTQTLKLL
jgi:hypothetical protein